MSRYSADPKPSVVTFRIAPKLKAELNEIAEREEKSVGELLRELVQERIKQARRREFEAEARRQSLIIAAAARDPNGDEAAVMRELEAHFEDVMREWK
jgi:metal-responsive CopG/Arc/MetJ family transcriptional regulator